MTTETKKDFQNIRNIRFGRQSEFKKLFYTLDRIVRNPKYEIQFVTINNDNHFVYSHKSILDFMTLNFNYDYVLEDIKKNYDKISSVKYKFEISLNYDFNFQTIKSLFIQHIEYIVKRNRIHNEYPVTGDFYQRYSINLKQLKFAANVFLNKFSQPENQKEFVDNFKEILKKELPDFIFEKEIHDKSDCDCNFKELYLKLSNYLHQFYQLFEKMIYGQIKTISNDTRNEFVENLISSVKINWQKGSVSNVQEFTIGLDSLKRHNGNVIYIIENYICTFGQSFQEMLNDICKGVLFIENVPIEIQTTTSFHMNDTFEEQCSKFFANLEKFKMYGMSIPVIHINEFSISLNFEKRILQINFNDYTSDLLRKINYSLDRLKELETKKIFMVTFAKTDSGTRTVYQEESSLYQSYMRETGSFEYKEVEFFKKYYYEDDYEFQNLFGKDNDEDEEDYDEYDKEHDGMEIISISEVPDCLRKFVLKKM